MRVTVSRRCEMLESMNGDLKDLDWAEALGLLKDSLVCRVASQHISHAACPVPSALLKAVEGEVGAPLRPDVSMILERS